jgi:lipoprotein NlpI
MQNVRMVFQCSTLALCVVAAHAADEPIDALQAQNAELTSALKTELQKFPTIDRKADNAVDQLSRRGDLHMFLGDFASAEADYRGMVELKPELDVSHWRLGIAMYYAGHPDQAAAQFDKYNSFDNVDRENGIWRYLSHHKAFGPEKAREQLLRYEKDDRPPFKEVYRLFEGKITAEEILNSIPATLDDDSKNSRLFYAHLYIGLNHAVEGREADARNALQKATQNSWPRKAGYGPNYMWHVGRLHYQLLKYTQEAPSQPPCPDSKQ